MFSFGVRFLPSKTVDVRHRRPETAGREHSALRNDDNNNDDDNDAQKRPTVMNAAGDDTATAATATSDDDNNDDDLAAPTASTSSSTPATSRSTATAGQSPSREAAGAWGSKTATPARSRGRTTASQVCVLGEPVLAAALCSPVLDATAVLAANCAQQQRNHTRALRRLAGVVHAVHWAEARLRLHEHQRNGRGFARVSGYANLATTPRICTGGAITCWHARQLLTAQRMVSVLNHGLQVQLHRDDVP